MSNKMCIMNAVSVTLVTHAFNENLDSLPHPLPRFKFKTC